MYDWIKMSYTKSNIHQKWDFKIEKYNFYIYNKIESTFYIEVQI